MEFYAYSSNPAPKATSGDATGPRVEPAIVSLLKDHVVKFTSKYLCSYHRSGLLSAVNREASVCIGKHIADTIDQSAENKRPSVQLTSCKNSWNIKKEDMAGI